MTKVHQYQENTIKYIKQKIKTLNLTILLGIALLLFLVFKSAYTFIDFVPQTSVSLLLAMLAILSGIIFAFSKFTTTQATNAIESYSKKLNTLLSTSRYVHQIDYSDVLLKNVIDSAVGITDADSAVLMIDNGDSILIKIVQGVANKELEQLTFIKSKGIVERVIENSEIINISDVEKTETYLSDLDHKIINEARSVICLPFTLNGKSIGALELIKKEAKFFGPEDEELLQYFVEQSALAMKKTVFQEDQKNYEIHLTNILIEAIERVTRGEGHLKRTVEYALLIGRGIGMSEKELETLYRACTLHDIGFLKIRIDEIASVEEYNEHALIGFKILDQINVYRDISYPVLHHHERYDGTGYPKGLAGEAIPLISRIISIAEVFDVMMNRRIHASKARDIEGNNTRKEMNFETALCELKKNAGTQFDPHLVHVFINKISERDIEIDRSISILSDGTEI